MFLDIDKIRGQISANISIHSQPPEDYKNLEKLQAMLADSVAQIKVAINSKNKEMLIILSDMLEYQKKRLDKTLFDEDNKGYRNYVVKKGKYAAPAKRCGGASNSIKG